MSENKYGICWGGDRIDLPNGCYATIETKHDEDMGPPWDEHDGHGPVSKIAYHPCGYGARPPKRSGQRLLYWDRGYYRLYDMQAATKLAKKDGWGLGNDELAELTKKLGHTPTQGQITAAAVERDFERMRGWANDEWHWIGVVVTLFDADDNEIGSDSLRGIESDGDYWKEVAAEILDELIERHEKETEEAQHWAARDVITT